MTLRNAKDLKGFTIHALDGELGSADELYFDDESWTIRYLTAKTGGWLGGRSVLISPVSIIDVNWDARRVNVSLSKDQVKDSPDIDTQRPVSRQHESALLSYYDYPNYWRVPYVWGTRYMPSVLAEPLTGVVESADSHLRSTHAIDGYTIHASDGDLGNVIGFVIDDHTWSIRYMEVSTGCWWRGRHVLISPAWIEMVKWLDSQVYVKLTRAQIQSGPTYSESQPITREYEEQLYRHYLKPCYWSSNTQPDSQFVLSGD